MINRRDLLKLFSAGSIVAPIVGATALAGGQVRLVEEAKFELIQEAVPVNPQPLWDLAGTMDQFDITVYFRNKRTTKVTRMDCSSFIVSVKNLQASLKVLDPPEVTLRLTEQIRMSSK